MDGALTVLATTHIGPENPNVSSVVLAGVNPNSALRYLNDVTVVWKATDKLTLTTDLNYIREEGFNAVGGGVAQYVTYALNDWLKITGRGEVWRVVFSLLHSPATWTLSGSSMVIRWGRRSAAERQPTAHCRSDSRSSPSYPKNSTAWLSGPKFVTILR